LAASAAPSTQHTPSGEFSVLGDFEEDRKPNIEYLDSLNEHNKRSRSAENEGDAERKQARVGDGDGVSGWGLGLSQQGQGQENGEQQQQHLPIHGVESPGLDAEVGVVAEDDPTVYGLYFVFWAFSRCRHAQLTFILSRWQTNAFLPSWVGAPRPDDGGRIYGLLRNISAAVRIEL
jgi:hypothetical protein